MLLRAHRLLQASVAAAVIASFASWQPVMMANMTALHPHAGHATHGLSTPGTPGAPGAPAAPRHHTPPPQCCDLCPVACAATPGIPGAAPRAAALEYTHPTRPVADREPRLPRARPHELPFSLGPPTLRVA